MGTWTRLAALAMLVLLAAAPPPAQEAPQLEWVHQFGRLRPANDWATAVDADGNVYVGGMTSGSLVGASPTRGRQHPVIKRYDSAGVERWSRELDSAETETVAGIAADATGVYVLRSGRWGVTLMKLDPDGGGDLWSLQIDTGGVGSGHGVAVDGTGVYVVGRTSGALPGQVTLGLSDAFVIKVENASGATTWSRQFGTEADDAALAVTATGGNVFVAGQTNSTEAAVWVLDAGGTEAWRRQFAGQWKAAATGIDADSTGIYVAGWTDGALPGQTAGGGTDAFLRRYELSGAESWTWQSEIAESDEAAGVAVGAAGVYVVGWSVAQEGGAGATGGTDALIRAFDRAGTALWRDDSGAPGTDQALAVSASAGRVYVAGTMVNPVRFDMDAFVRCYEEDAGGAVAWEQVFGGWVPATDMAQAVDARGNVFVAWANAGEQIITKYDPAGATVWTRELSLDGRLVDGLAVDGSGIYVAGRQGVEVGGRGEHQGYVAKLNLDDGGDVWDVLLGPGEATDVAVAAGGVYVAGQETGDATLVGTPFLRRLDNAGHELWSREFGAEDFATVAAVAADTGGAYVVGRITVELPGGAWRHDGYVRRFDSAGTELWGAAFGSAEDDWASAVATDGESVYVAGTWGLMRGDRDGPPTAPESSAFVRRYSPAGELMWHDVFGAEGLDEALGVAVGPAGVYVVGRTHGQLPWEGEVGATVPAGVNAFAKAYSAAGDARWTLEFGTDGWDEAAGVAVDGAAVYIVGSTDGTFEGQVSAGGRDAFIAKYVDGEVNRAPVADAGSDQMIGCPNAGLTPVVLDGSGSRDADGAGDIVAYEWRLGGALVGTDPVVVVDLVQGTYRALLTVTDRAGQAASDEGEIVIEGPVLETMEPRSGVPGTRVTLGGYFPTGTHAVVSLDAVPLAYLSPAIDAGRATFEIPLDAPEGMLTVSVTRSSEAEVYAGAADLCGGLPFESLGVEAAVRQLIDELRRIRAGAGVNDRGRRAIDHALAKLEEIMTRHIPMGDLAGMVGKLAGVYDRLAETARKGDAPVGRQALELVELMRATLGEILSALESRLGATDPALSGAEDLFADAAESLSNGNLAAAVASLREMIETLEDPTERASVLTEGQVREVLREARIPLVTAGFMLRELHGRSEPTVQALIERAVQRVGPRLDGGLAGTALGALVVRDLDAFVTRLREGWDRVLEIWRRGVDVTLILDHLAGSIRELAQTLLAAFRSNVGPWNRNVAKMQEMLAPLTVSYVNWRLASQYLEVDPIVPRDPEPGMTPDPCEDEDCGVHCHLWVTADAGPPVHLDIEFEIEVEGCEASGEDPTYDLLVTGEGGAVPVASGTLPAGSHSMTWVPAQVCMWDPTLGGCKWGAAGFVPGKEYWVMLVVSARKLVCEPEPHFIPVSSMCEAPFTWPGGPTTIGPIDTRYVQPPQEEPLEIPMNVRYKPGLFGDVGEEEERRRMEALLQAAVDSKNAYLSSWPPGSNRTRFGVAFTRGTATPDDSIPASMRLLMFPLEEELRLIGRLGNVLDQRKEMLIATDVEEARPNRRATPAARSLSRNFIMNTEADNADRAERIAFLNGKEGIIVDTTDWFDAQGNYRPVYGFDFVWAHENTHLAGAAEPVPGDPRWGDRDDLNGWGNPVDDHGVPDRERKGRVSFTVVGLLRDYFANKTELFPEDE